MPQQSRTLDDYMVIARRYHAQCGCGYFFARKDLHCSELGEGKRYNVAQFTLQQTIRFQCSSCKRVTLYEDAFPEVVPPLLALPPPSKDNRPHVIVDDSFQRVAALLGLEVAIAPNKSSVKLVLPKQK